MMFIRGCEKNCSFESWEDATKSYEDLVSSNQGCHHDFIRANSTSSRVTKTKVVKTTKREPLGLFKLNVDEILRSAWSL